jgi:cellulose synthase/poly-beta-1,6-N-acetylglucosamine synthase-like glycosyltransferase
MTKGKFFFSVIIPVRTITPYVRETIRFLGKQTEKNFETIVVTDKKEIFPGVVIIASREPTPAYKRNLGVQAAKGEILAFLDDDSYPSKNWLKNALKVFGESEEIGGVCGPTLTPSRDNVYQKASGWVWASWLGSGGAGVYRNRIMPRREVDDFPSVNLLVRKKDFETVGGFDINHWPGEDTKLCLDLIKLGKKIIYDPKVLVFHHRRAVFLPHLKQISRYALRRGHFARIFPETSLRLGYLLPSIFAYGLFFGLALAILFPPLGPIYLAAILLYALLLVLAGVEVLIKGKSFLLALLTTTAIFLTHLTYGWLFPIGYWQKKLKTVPHKIDRARKTYIGG